MHKLFNNTFRSGVTPAICLTPNLEAYPNYLYKYVKQAALHAKDETLSRSSNNLKYEIKTLIPLLSLKIVQPTKYKR